MTISDSRAIPPRNTWAMTGSARAGAVRGLRERPAVPRAPRVEEEGVQVIALCDLTTHL